MQQIAREFLTRCFAPSETIGLLLRTESPVKTIQRVVTLEQALAPRYLGWLAYQNHSGANVYVAANSLRPGSRKRTKECIHSIRHLYLDIDEDGDARLAALRASDGVPVPSAILSTSLGKYQALWRVEGFDSAAQEIMLKRLVITFGGDPACTDCNRVLRIPGFLNRKYSPAHCVAVEYPSAATYSPLDFRLPEMTEFATLPLRCNARPQSSPKTRIRNTIGRGSVTSLPTAKTLANSRTSWRPAAQINRILSTTRNAPSTLLPPVNGCSKALPSRMSSRCSKFAVMPSFPLHFAPLVRGRLQQRLSA